MLKFFVVNCHFSFLHTYRCQLLSHAREWILQCHEWFFLVFTFFHHLVFVADQWTFIVLACLKSFDIGIVHQVGLNQIVHLGVVEGRLANFKEAFKAFSLLEAQEVELELTLTEIALNDVSVRLEAHCWVEAFFGNPHFLKSYPDEGSILSEEYLSFIDQKSATDGVMSVKSGAKVLAYPALLQIIKYLCVSLIPVRALRLAEQFVFFLLRVAESNHDVSFLVAHLFDFHLKIKYSTGF